MASSYIRYISNEQHYTDVVQAVSQVKHDLWIATADIKDMYVKRNNVVIPFLKIIAELIERKINVRLIHAKEPGPNFRKDFDKYPTLIQGLERILCPRVHLKMIIFDLHTVYIGSANLTGAGLGMKCKNSRNFEAGIITNEMEIVNKATSQFDAIWIGTFCETCNRKLFCGDRIDKN
jgi:phosphatidylserine/phosphatidylglycerophosphate/cardiolipin synthase-like enzyme